MTHETGKTMEGLSLEEAREILQKSHRTVIVLLSGKKESARHISWELRGVPVASGFIGSSDPDARISFLNGRTNSSSVFMGDEARRLAGYYQTSDWFSEADDF